MKLALRVTGLVLRNEVQKPKHYVHKKLSDYMVAAKSSDNLWIAAGKLSIHLSDNPQEESNLSS